MVQIKYYPHSHKIDLKGHAGKGDGDINLVCCAVSTIFYNLAEVVGNYDDEMFKKEMVFKDKSGNAKIQAYPKGDAEVIISHDFAFAVIGFCMIAREYPELVNVEVVTA